MDSLPLILLCVYLQLSKICQRSTFKEVRELELLTSLLAVVVVVFLLSVSLAAMTLVLFVLAPVQGQAQQNQTNQTTIKTEGLNANSLDIQNIPLKKVHVGDIDVAYKMFGKGDPIILFNGASDSMDAWDPSFLTGLSSNHTVITFDSRGIANTTTGTKPYTMQQLANDAAGLLDALKIPNADVMGYSLGSYIAQAFTTSYPEKVNNLILVAATCGGRDGILPPPEFMKMQNEVLNKSVNNILTTADEMKQLAAASLGSGWIKLHPESLDIPENMTLLQSKPGLTPETMNSQYNVALVWVAKNWSGACDELAKIAKPTLVITGTDDNYLVPHGNSLVIASKVPGAWLVQIKDAGHAVMTQYPEEIGKIMNTFLSTTRQNR
jgi:pimeloyl-ACP methyl ester carboxylesterase